jgi:hypothetical protein
MPAEVTLVTDGRYTEVVGKEITLLRPGQKTDLKPRP